MPRVHYDELELDKWATGIYSWHGELFNGIAYELYPSGQMSSEGEYTEGRLMVYHEWYPSGMLKIETYARKNEESESLQREWFENGNLRREVVTGKIFRLREKRWNEQGELVYEYKRPLSNQQL